MDDEERIVEGQEPAEGLGQTEQLRTMSGFQRVWGTFFEPSKVFASLSQKPSWLLPVIILIVLVMVTSIVTRPLQIQEQVHRIEENERLSPEQKEQFSEIVRERANQPVWKAVGYIMPVVGVFIYVMLLTAIWYFGGNVLLGGNTTFKKVLSIFSYSTLVAIPGTIVKVPLMLAKKSVHVQTSLAALLPSGSDDSVLFKILAKFDIFTIWQYVLVAMGLAIIYKFTVKKSAGLVIAFFGIWIIISVGFSVLTKGRFAFG